ncbi:hypothetical protein EV191_106226 [Tamaricihabitans halophyticus]|uniref:Uncharacterized protein n=1 Tax=Tamaricihabitans halophyticus TaxID=1262583 RepID=A0A4R2QQM9_9PSEU|nr:XRE family transcriptional regulator [Tamaricihabitans halophyticus]TCP52062.1 hypothetical protein EV191_106226 [Tamaricihabitans halophyticus]
MPQQGSRRPARTLLEAKIRDRQQTQEEFVEYAETFAREHGEPGTLSLRHLGRLISGKASGPPLPTTGRLLERIFDVPIDELLGAPNPKASSVWQAPFAQHDDELAALELTRRMTASDVGNDTLTHLESIFDNLAMAYPAASPLELLPRIRRQLSYVMSLMDAKKTLAEHRRLLVVGGWLSLLAATVHIDLKQQSAASANLRTAASLARHAEYDEIRAWCYETEAWRALTDGDYPRAVELSKSAQGLASAGGSVAIQAAAQEGRAWARLGRAQETYSAIDRVTKLASPLAKPERAEHHYRYDPDKSVAYTATTLAWVGDPAGESYAREVILRLKPSDDVQKWPRRVASANLDLALTLIASDRLDESSHVAQQAILSGRIVPSNYWRAAEVVSAVESRQLPEAKELREAFEEMRQV